MLHFYAPNSWEFPQAYAHKFNAFGMGPEKARALARKLNLIRPRSWIVITGCAGGLKESIKTGDSFVIKSIHSQNHQWNLNIPKALEIFPQASLTSVESPAWTKEEKQKLAADFGADLVDCEMAYFLDALDEALYPQLIFLRTVIDTQDHGIGFFEGYKIQPLRILHPREFFRFVRFVWCFFLFRSRHSQFFKRVDRLMFLDESTHANELSL